jgi:hypothetical protein
MIFALATDDNALVVFANTEEAIAYCEGIDVEAGGWLFWNEGGAALKPEFLRANDRGLIVVGSGAYRLVPARGKPSLPAVLARVRTIEANPHFASIAELREYLG